jgi:hypothetical protein
MQAEPFQAAVITLRLLSGETAETGAASPSRRREAARAIPPEVPLDAGPLVVLLSRRNACHERARGFFTACAPPPSISGTASATPA